MCVFLVRYLSGDVFLEQVQASQEEDYLEVGAVTECIGYR